ncbi:carboxypeptidase-like regulatory domain-containing protein [bacterium]|nr:carboxypeptidase-like regulatory domain-containing protein [bacterium]
MKSTILKSISTAVFAFVVQLSMAQTASISGKIISEGKPLEFANVFLKGTQNGAATDTSGRYQIKNITAGTYQIEVSAVGFNKVSKTITLNVNDNIELNFDLTTNTPHTNRSTNAGIYTIPPIEELQKKDQLLDEFTVGKIDSKDPISFSNFDLVRSEQKQSNCLS